MTALSCALPCKISIIEDIELDGDMLEAQAFAYIAARIMYDLPISFPNTTGVRKPFTGGVISR